MKLFLLIKRNIAYLPIVVLLVMISSGCIQNNHPTDEKKTEQQIDDLNRYAHRLTYTNIDSAMLIADSALALAEHYDDKKGQAQAYKNRGTIGKNTGDRHAEGYLLKAIQIGESLHDTALISSTYLVLGQLYYRMGDKRDEAAQASMKGLQLAETIDHKEIMASCYNDLGMLDAELGDYESTINYFQKALEMYEALNVQSGVAVQLSSFAWLYSEMGESEKAVEYYQKAMQVAQKIHNKRYEAAFTLNIAAEYENTGKLDSALFFYQMSNTQFTAMHDVYGEALSLGNIASVYLTQGKQKRAIETTRRFLKKANQSGAHDEIMRAHKIMSEALALNKSFEKAYHHKNRYHQLKDSLFNAEKNRVISELQLKYETKKKDAEIERANWKLAKQNQKIMFWIAIAVLLLLILGVIIYLFVQKQRVYKKLLTAYNNHVKCMNNNFNNLKSLKLNDTNKEKLIHIINTKVINDKAYCLTNFNIATCASLLNTNRSYLSNVVNDVFQKSFSDFINELRIKEACYKLSETDCRHLTLEAVSESVGFANRNTFTRNFKKVTGVTPSFYMKNNAEC